MPTIQKLRHNLAQSQRWGAAFKEEIKRLMEELTQKNGEMGKMRKEIVGLNIEISRGECELKALVDEKLKSAYKKDKLQIKVQELQARIRVYEQGLGKRMEWNKELKKKLKGLEKEIQGQQNINAIDQIFDDVSESSISVHSFYTSKKQSRISAKSDSGYSMIECSLVRINKLEGDYLTLASKCKQKEDELERLKKTENRLKEKLKMVSTCDKENMKTSSNKQIGHDSHVELKQLQAKNRALSEKIQSQRTWITKYCQHLQQLLACEQTGESMRSSLVLLQREGRKQLKATMSICSFILRDHSSN